jgi:SAM-dependent methyltransferase
MSNQTELTDRTALQRNRARAAAAPAMFLQQHAASDVEERLTEINRTFTAPAVVTGWPDLWRDIGPDVRIVEDTEILDLGPAQHDLVIHGLSLHWASDPVGQLVQCRRALAPDGLLVATAFGGRTLHELRSCLAEAEARLTGGLSPRVAPMGEIRDMGGLLQRAGLALPVADSMALIVTYATAFDLMHDLRAMGEANALSARLRRPTGRAVFTEAAQIYHDTFGTEDGRISATFEIVTLTGWAPSESQQKPLRPGSASQRLADALGATETPISRTDD